MMRTLLLFLALITTSLSAEEPDLPVMYQGRVRPLSATPLSFDEHILVLPDKTKSSWHSLSEIDPTSKRNFSRYPDPLFFALAQAKKEGNLSKARELLSEAADFTFKFKAERFYTRTPLLPAAILLYTASLLLLLFQFRNAGLLFFALAFAVHTLILALRSYILGRPPVSNMGETLIYVPWIGALVAGGWTLYTKETLAAFAAAFLSAVLLLMPLNEGLENVQPVLNSSFWLAVHVLMIVASYGVLLLAGVLGHIYLWNKKGGHLLLPTLYIGVALLIPGTLLGGIWAAESWGRFWDWDPKESWAFISSAIYLIAIHLYRFGKIGTFGLAIGSIVGLLAISFTWYGVNYILGVGLHSYGFGQGGEIYYFLFVIAEVLIICASLINKNLRFTVKCDKN